MVNPLYFNQYAYPAYTNNYSHSPAFRGGTYNSVFTSLPNESKNKDTITVTQSESKKKLTSGQKWAIGIGGGVGIIATIALLIKKNQYSEVKQLAENIVFERASTLEDAIKFGKEKLGIRSYQGFESKDLDVINWINEGIVNTSNKLKGKLRVPKMIHYTDKHLGSNTLAGVITDTSSVANGYFGVNKNIFDNLDVSIKEALENLKPCLGLNKDGFYYHPYFSEKDMRKVVQKIVDFNNNKINSFGQKLEFYSELETLIREINSINEAPLNKIKNVLKNKVLLESLTKNGVNTDIKAIESLSKEEQANLLGKMFETFEKDRINAVFKHTKGDKFRTIYHEMGHLQDDVARVKPADKYKNPSKYPPELKEWLENDEYQRLANCVSSYASTGPGEFIADTFAELVTGKKLDEEVIALYKKLNGPMVAGI